MTADLIVRVLGMFLFAFAGGVLSATVRASSHPSTEHTLPYQLLLVLCGAALGALVTPHFTTYPFRWLKDRIRAQATADLLVAAAGLAIGLFLALLLVVPLALLPGPLNWIMPIVACVVLGYLGVYSATVHMRDVTTMLPRRWRSRGAEPEPGAPVKGSNAILLDTSAIIDGRIVDVCATGFVRGVLTVPRFVLDELQHIADSSDGLRRARGRRGLDLLNKLQKDTTNPLEFVDDNPRDIPEVDGKLIKLARLWRCPIVTGDYNLNRVAELQGVTVLNINELANAVKSVVLPGEEMAIKIIQDGKEFGQGVGYLEDGTMVVVENGRGAMTHTVDVVVTRVLQTHAGRMIFAHLKPSGVGHRV